MSRFEVVRAPWPIVGRTLRRIVVVGALPVEFQGLLGLVAGQFLLSGLHDCEEAFTVGLCFGGLFQGGRYPYRLVLEFANEQDPCSAQLP